MKLIRVGAAVLNQVPLDWDHNRKTILDAIARAKREGVTILCLPEMCITGYGVEDAFHAPGVYGRAMDMLLELAPHCAGMIVSLGLPLYHQKALYNVACLVCDGQIAGFVGKRFLAGDGLHYEPRWFKPWPEDKQSYVDVAGKRYPLGDLCFDIGGVRVGFEICEDAWVANRPGTDLALRGVDVILNPSASHFAFHKFTVRQRFVVEGSRAFGTTYVYANLLGNEAGRVIYDGGALIANGGQLVASGRRFSFAEVELTTAVVDIDQGRVDQVRRGSHKPLYDEEGMSVVSVPFVYPQIAPEPAKGPAPEAVDWEKSAHIKEEEFTRAIALALFDYLRKSRSRGFVVSMSGGADSAAVAVLSSLAITMAAAELGFAELKRRLAHIPDAATAQSAADLVPRMLLCAYQATRNSSTTTFEAARAVALAVGAEFVRFDIDALVSGYVAMGEGALGRKLSWESDDIALQNIQARVRGPGVWLLANVRGALLLATSNRSEAAVGYATMDGDTCGGLSPIAGIDKAFLRNWLRWMERVGPSGGSPIPALDTVTVQAPTAELRPPAAEQTDEGDLMPYPLLDAIESAAIGDKQMPVEVFLRMRASFPQYSATDLAVWIRRFFRLWCQNQWKRERYAPSFHVDDKDLDPRAWCRFPILSGGFVRELAELDALVASLSKASA